MEQKLYFLLAPVFVLFIIIVVVLVNIGKPITVDMPRKSSAEAVLPTLEMQKEFVQKTNNDEKEKCFCCRGEAISPDESVFVPTYSANATIVGFTQTKWKIGSSAEATGEIRELNGKTYCRTSSGPWIQKP